MRCLPRKTWHFVKYHALCLNLTSGASVKHDTAHAPNICTKSVPLIIAAEYLGKRELNMKRLKIPQGPCNSRCQQQSGHVGRGG